MAHLSDGEKGKIDDVRIWYKRLNQQLSRREVCRVVVESDRPRAGVSGSSQKCTPPPPSISSVLQLRSFPRSGRMLMMESCFISGWSSDGSGVGYEAKNNGF